MAEPPHSHSVSPGTVERRKGKTPPLNYRIPDDIIHHILTIGVYATSGHDFAKLVSLVCVQWCCVAASWKRSNSPIRINFNPASSADIAAEFVRFCSGVNESSDSREITALLVALSPVNFESHRFILMALHHLLRRRGGNLTSIHLVDVNPQIFPFQSIEKCKRLRTVGYHLRVAHEAEFVNIPTTNSDLAWRAKWVLWLYHPGREGVWWNDKVHPIENRAQFPRPLSQGASNWIYAHRPTWRHREIRPRPSPFDRIPEEILSQIFTIGSEDVAPQYRGPGADRGLEMSISIGPFAELVRSVCKKWHSVVNFKSNFKQLWHAGVRLYLSDSLDDHGQLLARFKANLTRIRTRGCRNVFVMIWLETREAWWLRVFAAALSILNPHKSHVVSLGLNNASGQLIPFLEEFRSYPNLRTLRYDGTSGEAFLLGAPEHDALRHLYCRAGPEGYELPSIKRLILSRLPGSHFPPSPNLTELIIRGHSVSMAIQWDELANLVLRYPTLVAVWISDIYFEEGSFPPAAIPVAVPSWEKRRDSREVLKIRYLNVEAGLPVLLCLFRLFKFPNLIWINLGFVENRMLIGDDVFFWGDNFEVPVLKSINTMNIHRAGHRGVWFLNKLRNDRPCCLVDPSFTPRAHHNAAPPQAVGNGHIGSAKTNSKTSSGQSHVNRSTESSA